MPGIVSYPTRPHCASSSVARYADRSHPSRGVCFARLFDGTLDPLAREWRTALQPGTQAAATCRPLRSRTWAARRAPSDRQKYAADENSRAEDGMETVMMPSVMAEG